MKVNDIVNEGMWGDLQALGRAQQAQTVNQIGKALQNVTGAITPDWYKKMADKVSQAKSDQQAAQLAEVWTLAWGKEFEAMEKAAGKPFTDDEYRGLLRAWVEKTAKVNVDPTPLKLIVTVQSQEAVKQYFKNHFIPGYLKAQANPMFVIPNGTVVDVTTTVGKKTTGARYTWDATKGRFVDNKSREVPTYTQLHADLLQQAMDQATASSGGTVTIGGGGAATV